MALRLWQIPFSTNVERVALALAHKGLDAEAVVVDPSDRASVRDLTGQELVPVVDHDGVIVADSIRIVAYLEEHFPDPPLYPRDAVRREEVEVFLDWFNQVWKAAPNLLADALEAGRDPAEPELDAWAKTLHGSLNRFERLLDGRDYLFAADFGVADLAVFPFLRYGVQLDEADEDVFHRILADHLSPEPEYPRIRAWIARCNERPRAGTSS